MSEDANRAVVRRMWELFQARDWEPALELLADDLVVSWPATRERIIGRENFLAVNRNYPEPWGDISIVQVMAKNDRVASEVRVEAPGATFFAVGFYELRDGRISRATEYWVTEGGEPPPRGREAWVQRY